MKIEIWGYPLPPFRPYAQKNLKISPKITDFELETNEFHHDPGLKMCFLQVIFDINEIVFNVILFALLSIVVGGKYSELFQNFQKSLIQRGTLILNKIQITSKIIPSQYSRIDPG